MPEIQRNFLCYIEWSNLKQKQNSTPEESHLLGGEVDKTPLHSTQILQSMQQYINTLLCLHCGAQHTNISTYSWVPIRKFLCIAELIYTEEGRASGRDLLLGTCIG
jgi:hypothetical protein